MCVLVGDPRAIDRAVRQIDAARRHTGLAARIGLALRDPDLLLGLSPDPEDLEAPEGDDEDSWPDDEPLAD